MKILVINGPNLNMLGKRESTLYGVNTLSEINNLLKERAKKYNVRLSFFQSNAEGTLIDFIQKESSHASGILINPGALTHYGYSLRDALVDLGLPIVEVHLSDIESREKFRKTDVLDGIVLAKIVGLKKQSYLVGLEKLCQVIRKRNV